MPKLQLNWKRAPSFSLSKEQQRAPWPFAPQPEEQNHRMVVVGTSGTCVVSLLKAGSPLTGYLGSFPFRSGFEHLQVQGDSTSLCVCWGPRTRYSTPDGSNQGCVEGVEHLLSAAAAYPSATQSAAELPLRWECIAGPCSTCPPHLWLLDKLNSNATFFQVLT